MDKYICGSAAKSIETGDLPGFFGFICYGFAWTIAFLVNIWVLFDFIKPGWQRLASDVFGFFEIRIRALTSKTHSNLLAVYYYNALLVRCVDKRNPPKRVLLFWVTRHSCLGNQAARAKTSSLAAFAVTLFCLVVHVVPTTRNKSRFRNVVRSSPTVLSTLLLFALSKPYSPPSRIY